MTHPPLVYFIGSREYVKIGTTTNLHVRFNDLAKPLPFEVELLGVMEGGADVERDVQRRFALQHTRMEWFILNEPLLAFIKAYTEPFQVRRKRDYEPYFDLDSRQVRRAKLSKDMMIRQGRRMDIDQHVKAIAQQLESSIA